MNYADIDVRLLVLMAEIKGLILCLYYIPKDLPDVEYLEMDLQHKQAEYRQLIKIKDLQQ